MTQEVLRVGVVGAGHLGRFHAEKYAHLPGVRLVAVADRDIARAQASAVRHGAAAEPEAERLLGKVDCVSVAVPTREHFSVVRSFLGAGVDVLVEKPLAATRGEGRELLRLAESSGRILQVGHLERFNPAVGRLLERTRGVRFVEAHRLASFVERGTDVDVIRDLMIHDLDILLALLPVPLRSVEAVGVPVLSECIDIANARLRFADGAIANLTASRVSTKRERKLRVFQPDAYFSLDYEGRQLRTCWRRVTPEGGPEVEWQEETFDDGDPLEAELRAFVTAVRSRQPPPVSAHDGLRALEAAEQVIAALETA